jgi:hypothetical protein
VLAAEDAPTSTGPLPDIDYEESMPRFGTARFGSHMNLVIRLRDSATTFVYEAAQIDELLLGRFDPVTRHSPDVDLHEYAATEKGVSRRHAVIVRRDGALNLIDQGSPNGTFLNGQRLIPHQPRILRDGDDVRLGHLVLEIHFERANDDA